MPPARTQRLRSLVQHLAARTCDGGADDEVVQRQGGVVGLPLARQDARTGRLTAESVAELTERMASAATRLDFRTASHLKTMLDVLAPRSGALPIISTFASTSADKAADLFLEHGFCVLPSVIAEPELQRMRASYEAVADGCRAWYEARVAAGVAHPDGPLRRDVGKQRSFPMLEEQHGTAFFPLLDPPQLMHVLHRILGAPAMVNDSMDGVVVPVADDTLHEADGYIAWHRDTANGTTETGWPFPFKRSIKASTYLYDVPENGAPLALVPGSHRLPHAPQQTLDGSFLGGRGHYRKPLRLGAGASHIGTHTGGTGTSPDAVSFWHAARQEELPRGFDDEGEPLWIGDPAMGDLPSDRMPNCVPVCVPAGWTIVFDTCTWHVALPNTHADRVGATLSFTAGASAMPLSRQHRDALEKEGALSAQRKAAFGLALTEDEEAILQPELEAAERWIRRRTGGFSN